MSVCKIKEKKRGKGGERDIAKKKYHLHFVNILIAHSMWRGRNRKAVISKLPIVLLLGQGARERMGICRSRAPLVSE
jgi:hypothetical protein